MMLHTFQNRKNKHFGLKYSQAYGNLLNNSKMELKQPFNKWLSVGQHEKEVECVVALENDGKKEIVVAGSIPEEITEISGETYHFKDLLKTFGFEFEKESKIWKREAGKRTKVFINVPTGSWVKSITGRIDETKKASYIFEGEYLEKNEFNHLIIGGLVLSKIGGKFSLYRIEAIDENEVSFNSKELSHQELLLEGSWDDDNHFLERFKEVIKQAGQTDEKPISKDGDLIRVYIDLNREGGMIKQVLGVDNGILQYGENLNTGCVYPFPKSTLILARTRSDKVDVFLTTKDGELSEQSQILKKANADDDCLILNTCKDWLLKSEVAPVAQPVKEGRVGWTTTESKKMAPQRRMERIIDEAIAKKNDPLPKTNQEASEVAPVKQVNIKDLRKILENFAKNNKLPSNLTKIKFHAYEPRELKCQFFYGDSEGGEEVFYIYFVGNKEGVVDSCNLKMNYEDVFEGFTNEELKYIDGMRAAAGLSSLPPIVTNLFVAKTNQDEEIKKLRRENEVLDLELNEKASVIIGAQHVEINNLKAEIERLSSKVAPRKVSALLLETLLKDFFLENPPETIEDYKGWFPRIEVERIKDDASQFVDVKLYMRDELDSDELLHYILRFEESDEKEEINYFNIIVGDGFSNEFSLSEINYFNKIIAVAGLGECTKPKSTESGLEVAPVKSVSTKEIEESGLSVEKTNDTVLWCLASPEQPAAVIVASFILNKVNRELYEPHAGQFLEMDQQRQELVKQILHTKSDIVESVKPDVISALVDTFGKSCDVKMTHWENGDEKQIGIIGKLKQEIEKLKQPKPKYRWLQAELKKIRKDGSENQKAFLKGLSLRSKYGELLKAWENIPPKF
jgi:hypothetical protein